MQVILHDFPDILHIVTAACQLMHRMTQSHRLQQMDANVATCHALPVLSLLQLVLYMPQLLVLGDETCHLNVHFHACNIWACLQLLQLPKIAWREL